MGMNKAFWGRVKPYLFLHIILLIYSGSMICSKLAASREFMSLPFLFYYGLVMAALAVYALLWQQVLKLLPLTTAYANKAVTIVWGLLWGRLFFGERLTAFHILGSVIIMAGIGLVVSETDE